MNITKHANRTHVQACEKRANRTTGRVLYRSIEQGERTSGWFIRRTRRSGACSRSAPGLAARTGHTGRSGIGCVPAAGALAEPVGWMRYGPAAAQHDCTPSGTGPPEIRIPPIDGTCLPGRRCPAVAVPGADAVAG